MSVNYPGCRFARVAMLLCSLRPRFSNAANPLDGWFEATDEAAIRPPEEVFIASVEQVTHEKISIRWHIEPGHYLYRNAFRFALQPPAVSLGEPAYSEATVVTDPHFGVSEIFRDSVRVTLPLIGEPSGFGATLRIDYQGCIENRLCYPPAHTELFVTFPAGIS